MKGHPGMDDDKVPGLSGSSNTSSSSHTMSMGSMGNMEMTFTDWSNYSLTLLLSSWKIRTQWQFFLTWILVFSAAILLHGVKFAVCALDCMIINTAKSNLDYQGMHHKPATSDVPTFQTSKRLSRPNGWRVLKLLHGLLMGFQYGLSLMLMLVSTWLLVN
jgi:Ctr copper transporter family